MAEKTEKATPKKLRDARKKGQVAKAQDLPAALTFVVSVGAVLASGAYLYSSMSGFLIDLFNLIGNQHLDQVIPGAFAQGIYIIMSSTLPALIVVSLVGVLVNFLVVGPVFSFEVFKFDPKKFDPVQNLKAKFKLKTLVELLKSIVKIAVASYLIYGVMYNSIPVLVHAVNLPLWGDVALFTAFLMEVVIKVGLFFLVVAVLDFAYQKHTFASEMKMEKFEVKQEYKNTEGNPEIKGKRRQIAQEIAYQEGPSAAVAKAQAVVTNPTHLAIAIAYNREIDPAPYILYKGKDEMAERAIHIAKKANVPIVRNIPLAHKLWDQGELYDFVPESTYEALAEILRWIAELQTDENAPYVPTAEI